jgi:hypothetical protein
MKVSDLTGALLDYWTARANESWTWAHELFPTMTLDPTFRGAMYDNTRTNFFGESAPACFLVPTNPFRQDHKLFAPSTNWEHGGPIIERERITLSAPSCGPMWSACAGPGEYVEEGATPLIAAMRAYVASRYGHQVPDETEGA